MKTPSTWRVRSLLRERRDRAAIELSGLFDRAYYLKDNPDVAAAGLDPLTHYLRWGAREGRDPGTEFQTAYYLATNADVRSSGINPLVHFIRHGRAEGRMAMAPSTAAAGRHYWRGDTAPGARAAEIVVCTASVGGYGVPFAPEHAAGGCDYVLFTDRAIQAPAPWTVKPLDACNDDPVRAARYVKTHPHAYFGDYAHCVWIDGNVALRGDPRELIAGLGDAPLAAFRHPLRDCTFDEGETCIRGRRDDAGLIEAQLARYARAGLGRHAGLWETNVLVSRPGDARLAALMAAWWREIDNGSRRDQIGLVHAARRTGVDVAPLAPAGISARNDTRARVHAHPRGAGASRWLLPGWRRQPPSLIELEALDRLSVDIVVCVNDSLDDVRRCLASVASTRRPRHRIIVVDDGSQPPTAAFCADFAARDPASRMLIRHQRARGYTRAANAGLRESSADYVILLNSDTEVTGHWASKLLRCAEGAPDIGIVGPVSSAASWQSVPCSIDADGGFAINTLDAPFTAEQMDRIAELASVGTVRVPLVNGFCLAIKRAVLDAVGLFDEDSFDDAYGEENDYCFRASDAGFGLAVATDTYVFHAKSKSYTAERRAGLSARGGAALARKYPAHRIDNAVRSLRGNRLLDELRARVARLMSVASGDGGARTAAPVLFVLPVRPGGGGVHSVVQEALAMRRFGVAVAVAVRAEHHRRYQDDYGEPELFLGFDSDETLYRLSHPYRTLVATAYVSVAMVAELRARYPDTVAAYYVQDYEPYFFDPERSRSSAAKRERARESYVALPDSVLFAKTDWLRRTVEAETGRRPFKVRPSLDRGVFHPPATPRSAGARCVVAAMVRLATPRRAPARTVAVLREAMRRLDGRLEAHLFGTDADDPALHELCQGAAFTVHGTLRREAVAELLRATDLFVDFSDYQAFGRGALEAMACGCAVIVPRAGGADEFAVDGDNCLVVDSTSADGCLGAVLRLATETELRARLADKGMRTAAAYDVDGAALSELLVLEAAALAR